MERIFFGGGGGNMLEFARDISFWVKVLCRQSYKNYIGCANLQGVLFHVLFLQQRLCERLCEDGLKVLCLRARVHEFLRKNSVIRHFQHLTHCVSTISIVKEAPIRLSPSVTHIAPPTRLCLCKVPYHFYKNPLHLRWKLLLFLWKSLAFYWKLLAFTI